MDPLLKELLCAAGVSGYENDIAGIMSRHLKKSCDAISSDSCGNVIAKKGKGKKKVMLVAHMDEIGLLVKHITKEGFIYFIKIGGIDERILAGQRVIIKAKSGDFPGIIGSKPPHLQKEEDRKHSPKYEDMYIDIGCLSKEEAEKKIKIADPIIFEPNAGVLGNGMFYGKAVDDRVGCYVLLKAMERINVPAEVYAVGSTQEEVGLKGARTASFRINPDFAIAIDTTLAGDTPEIKERESTLKVGAGVAITTIEASGRGFIMTNKVKDMLIEVAVRNKIKYQLGVLEGGMTDAAIIYVSREGILSAVLSVPSRYIHAPTGVFSKADADAAVDLTVKAVEQFVKTGF